MKVAILVGISKYIDSQNNLPFCDLDLQLMKQLLELTNEYDNIFTVSGEMSSSKIKNSIAEWIESHRNSKLDEVFFYYTGHGEFYNSEFYFQLPDFDATKRHQTSLTNKELDNWLRSLNPELTVKVIDSCNSGVLYIKGSDNPIGKYLDSTKQDFNKCIFMFSSTTSQSSYPDDSLKISAFTKILIDAVKFHGADTIRYRDIMDYISDKFEHDITLPSQTPVFVTQTHNTEIFCHLIDLEIRKMDYDQKYKIYNPISDLKEIEISNVGLKQIIEREALNFVTKEKALEILNQFQGHLEQYAYSNDLITFYDIEYSLPTNLQTLSSRKAIAIGQWLIDNKNEFFAEPTYKEVELELSTTELMSISIASFGRSNPRRTKLVVDGYKLTFDGPFQSIRILARRKFLSIPTYYCAIAYLASRSKVKLFYFFARYKDKNFDEMSLEVNMDWQSIECSFGKTDELWAAISNIQTSFDSYIINELKARFGQQE